MHPPQQNKKAVLTTSTYFKVSTPIRSQIQKLSFTIEFCIFELVYNQLQKSLPRLLQKIWNYKQLLKTAPDQSMLRVRVWKLMQHWFEGGWGAAKLTSVWIRVWQRYFVTDCLKKLEMYCIFFFWDVEGVFSTRLIS